MIKNLLLILVSAITYTSYSQTRADNWYFGIFARLNFTSGVPVAGSGSLNSTEGTASMSDAAGTTLFYTDGVTVWDVTDTPMPNGSGLMGDGSSTQSAMIVPFPQSPTKFYLFTTPPDGGSAGFRYSIIDMTLNSGKGDVTSNKNILLTDSITEKICAIKDISGSGYWIMVHKWGTDEFYGYHLTASGISAPVISHSGSVHTTSTFQNTYGQMKFNMCGDRIALAIGYSDKVELFDFDKSTGIVSNAISLAMGSHVYGVEFSRNAQNLFVTTYSPSETLIELNITFSNAPLIMASKFPLSSTSGLYALQIGPDEKIYVAESFGSAFLGVINNPDVYGPGSNYNESGVLIDPNGNGVGGSLGLPSFLQDILKGDMNCSVGIEESELQLVSLIYPNPSSSCFKLVSTTDILEVNIYDNIGKLVEIIRGNYSNYIFGNNYPSGMYLISVKSNRSTTYLKAIKN